MKTTPLFVLAAAAVSMIAPFNVTPSAAADCGAEAGPDVNWEGCRKRNLVLSGSNLKNANFKWTNFSSTDMRDSTFDGANFNKSVLLRVFFDGSTAPNSDFEKAIVYRVNFKATDLTNARFQKAEMLRVNFTGANLYKANFSKAEAGRTIFDGATLVDNDFSFASLARADFRNAKISGTLNFEGAFLYQARFEGVDLSSASGLKQWQVDMICGDEKTKFPAGVNRPEKMDCGGDE